jgi:DNA-binding protein H-NS
MEILFWLLGIAAVLWFLNSARDSTYDQMVDDMQPTDEERAKWKAEIEEAALLKKDEVLSKAKYALIDHPKYGTVTWAGRGRKPKWLVEYLANGGTLEEIEKKN